LRQMFYSPGRGRRCGKRTKTRKRAKKRKWSNQQFNNFQVSNFTIIHSIDQPFATRCQVCLKIFNLVYFLKIYSHH
uniref:40S ribosomal protein S30 n=1 Tax=Anisakis simplex TaxID=6269 RepID=A0A0M3JGF4_ANISI